MIKKRYMLTAMVIIIISLLSGCSQDMDKNEKFLGNQLHTEGSMELKYAKNFSVDYYKEGYALISISDGSRYLIVPEGKDIPTNLDKSITILRQPINNIYLVATSAMCLFDALDSLDTISLSGTKAEDWYIENAKAAMKAGDIIYAGKYNIPDYELIMSNNCKLAIESTMINHTPEVKDKLEELGIPVLTDQSSYESHPLGRTEWIKLYGLLTGKESEAKQLFDEQASYIDQLASQEKTDKTVAFFYISSSGNAIARKSGDYVTRMIELAGGNYIFDHLGNSESATSTVTLEMEEFYATAKDADFIIYNSTIDGELSSIEELIGKNSLLKDFKAVQNDNVWCTSKNMFQETTQFGLMISDIHRMLTNDDKDLAKLNFMYKLSATDGEK
ncbi:ABC transporter substrate-binding protein [Tissierellaceae bacterium BX21]|uniref:ABC transporter substrate-binding protein n=2 Tax=Paratissierella segnis TaxID=2763679 RepID=A0A926IJE7_9FIRM|nr:ABC transporter substrate-binding protein [Paratissierella segnis]